MPKIKKPLLVTAGSDDRVVKIQHVLLDRWLTNTAFNSMIEGAEHSFRGLYADQRVDTIIEFIEQ
jgi:hypothetical protein